MFGYYRIKRDIPSLSYKPIELLKIVRQANQPGTVQVIAQAFEGEGAIVKAAAHAETSTRCIKGNQWNEHHVEGPGHNRSVTVRYRLGYPIAVAYEAVSPVKGCKPQAFCGPSPEYGQIDLFAGLEGAAHKGERIDLAVCRDVEGDALAVSEGFEVDSQALELSAMASLGRGGELPSLGAHHATDFRWVHG